MTARVGDLYNFIYPNEPQFNCELEVVRVHGDQTDDMVFFDDGSHSKQKNLVDVPKVNKIEIQVPVGDN